MQGRARIGIVLVTAIVAGIGLLISVTAKELKPDPNAVFPVETLKVITASGEFMFTIEIADEEPERQRGLMFRETMLPTHGMLFDFDSVGPVAMWMKNTILSLDMVFVRPDGTVARVEVGTVPGSLRVISSGEPVSHVLELKSGVTNLINLKPGDRLVHSSFETSQ